MNKKSQSEILALIFIIIFAILIIFMFVSHSLKPKDNKPNSMIIIADKYYNTLFDNTLYTSCKKDMSLIRLLQNFYEGLTLECDDSQPVDEYLQNFFNQSLIFFLKSNNLAYKMNISDGYTEFYFEEGNCIKKFVYTLPAQTILTPKTSRQIKVSLIVCKQ